MSNNIILKNNAMKTDVKSSGNSKRKSSPNGKIYLVGVGPGTLEGMTIAAHEVIKKADVIIGHKSLIQKLGDLLTNKEIIDENMTPIQRIEKAIDRHKKNNKVAIISVGDTGIFAIAGTFFGYIKENKIRVNVEVIPGVNTATTAAALLGSPLCHDCAMISLADRLISWAKIRKRLEAAAQSGFIIALYNPKGNIGDRRVEKALTIIRLYAKQSTVVGIVTGKSNGAEEVKILKLRQVTADDIDANSIIIIGNSRTSIYEGWMVTRRDYRASVGY